MKKSVSEENLDNEWSNESIEDQNSPFKKSGSRSPYTTEESSEISNKSFRVKRIRNRHRKSQNSSTLPEAVKLEKIRSRFINRKSRSYQESLTKFTEKDSNDSSNSTRERDLEEDSSEKKPLSGSHPVKMGNEETGLPSRPIHSPPPRPTSGAPKRPASSAPNLKKNNMSGYVQSENSNEHSNEIVDHHHVEHNDKNNDSNNKIENKETHNNNNNTNTTTIENNNNKENEKITPNIDKNENKIEQNKEKEEENKTEQNKQKHDNNKPNVNNDKKEENATNPHIDVLEEKDPLSLDDIDSEEDEVESSGDENDGFNVKRFSINVTDSRDREKLIQMLKKNPKEPSLPVKVSSPLEGGCGTNQISMRSSQDQKVEPSPSIDSPHQKVDDKNSGSNNTDFPHIQMYISQDTDEEHTGSYRNSINIKNQNNNEESSEQSDFSTGGDTPKNRPKNSSVKTGNKNEDTDSE